MKMKRRLLHSFRKSNPIKAKLLAGLTCLTMCGVAETVHAQGPPPFFYNSTRFAPLDGADYKGYSIANFRYYNPAVTSNLEGGYVAAGNRRRAGGLNDSINVLTIPAWEIPGTMPAWSAPSLTMGTNIGIAGFEDLRVISINPVYALVAGDTADVAITVQARQPGQTDKIAIVLMKCKYYGVVPSVLKTYTIQSTNHLYAQGAAVPSFLPQWTINQSTLYFCGYTVDNTHPGFPVEPSLSTDKEAFIGKINLETGTTLLKSFNTQQDATAPPPEIQWDNRINDYDAALRVRWIHGTFLVVCGSANGTAFTSWPGNPNWPVNSSKSWIAKIDTSDLSFIFQDFCGETNVISSILPSSKSGTDGVDVSLSHIGSHPFWLLQNRLDINRWYATHVDNPGGVSMPSNGFNSFYFTDPSISQKSLGIIENGYGPTGATASSSRIVIYGAKDAYHFATGFGAYFDVNFGASIDPLQPAPRYVWWNSTNPASSIITNEPYWMSTDLAIWSNPSAGARYVQGTVGYPFVTGNNPDDLAMMGHSAPGGQVIPRILQGNQDGAFDWGNSSFCQAIIDPLFQNIGIINLFPLTIQQTVSNPETIIEEAAAGNAEVYLRIDDCVTSGNGVYRNINNGIIPMVSRIFPNPATNYVSIEFTKELDNSTPVEFTMLDVTGREIFRSSRIANGRLLSYDLPQLAAGVYWGQINQNGKLLARQKILIAY